MTPRLKRSDTAVAAAALLAIAVAALTDQPLIVINESASVPRGLYVRAGEPPVVGLYARVQAMDVAASYVQQRPAADHDAVFLKRIAAAEGDFVCADTDAVIVERVRLTRAWRDASGRALPHWGGCRRLRAGEFFLVGDAEASFDSRYWGPVSHALVEDAWRPLWIDPTSP